MVLQSQGRPISPAGAESFDDRVADLLMETEFPGDGKGGHVAMLNAGRRAERYAKCSRFWSGVRCVPCKANGRETFRYRHVVKRHLRGCSRCGASVRLNLVNRYLFRLLRFKRRMLRHVILTFTWVGVASVNLYDFLLSCVSKLWRRLKRVGCCYC